MGGLRLFEPNPTQAFSIQAFSGQAVSGQAVSGQAVSGLDLIEAPLDPPRLLIEAAKTLAERSEEGQELALVLLKRGMRNSCVTFSSATSSSVCSCEARMQRSVSRIAPSASPICCSFLRGRQPKMWSASLLRLHDRREIRAAGPGGPMG